MPETIIKPTSEPETRDEADEWVSLSVDRTDASTNFTTANTQIISVEHENSFAPLNIRPTHNSISENSFSVDAAAPVADELRYANIGSHTLTDQQRMALLLEAERRDQSTLDWAEKLEAAVFRTVAQLTENFPDSDRNGLIVEHLEGQSQIGDIIFVSTQGKGEPVLTEIFKDANRNFSMREDVDFNFPFTQVFIHIGNDTLLDVSTMGVHETSWGRLLINNELFDAVAVGRLEASREAREAYASRVKLFAENSHFDYLRMRLSDSSSNQTQLDGTAIIELGAPLAPTANLDLATRSAQILRSEGVNIGDDIEHSVTALDLFSASSVRIVEASVLKR